MRAGGPARTVALRACISMREGSEKGRALGIEEGREPVRANESDAKREEGRKERS